MGQGISRFQKCTNLAKKAYDKKPKKGVKMSKDRIIDRKHLLSLRRDKIRVNQKSFAEIVGMPVDTLRSYEQGRRLLTADKFREIKDCLGYREDNGSLRVMIDYLRITFKEVTDLDFFCQTYLYCPLSEFVSTDTKLMMYTHLWRRGDIWIFDYADKSQTGNYQITLQLSGAGCRQYELILEREGLIWEEALQKMYFERSDMKTTRVDIALDEMYLGYDNESEQLQLSDLITKVYHGELLYDRMNKWNYIGGGSLDMDSGESNGISIYFGSRQSDMYFNFYEKRYELAKKEKMTVTESLEVFDIWNRYEIRLSQGKAHKWLEDFVGGVPIDDLSKGIIRQKLEVYDGNNDWGAYLPDSKWQRLFGDGMKVKLSTSPEAYSIERTIKWLVYQVSNSLKLVEEADKILNTAYLRLIMEAGELTEETENVLKQLSVSDIQFIEEELRKGA